MSQKEPIGLGAFFLGVMGGLYLTCLGFGMFMAGSPLGFLMLLVGPPLFIKTVRRMFDGGGGQW